MSDRLKLAREIAARTKPRFIEIPRERGGVRVPFTEEQLTAMRGGLTAEEYRWKLIREWRDQRLRQEACHETDTLTMVVAGLVLTATPAFAAPQWVEDACWRYAQRVTPHLTEREKEAYVPTA